MFFFQGKAVSCRNCENRDRSFYRGCRGTCDSTHYIRADSIEQVVIMELGRLAEFLTDDEDAFTELLEQKTNAVVLAE